MEFDLMTNGGRWDTVTTFAKDIEAAGFSGMLFTETSKTPWMSIAAASMAAPSLSFSTGIAVAFPRSPMISAAIAWELAENTQGKFRLGLGSQVAAHIKRRYSAEFDSPGPRLRDYVLAVKACFRAFNREEPLHHDGPFYQLSLLPEAWTPPAHEFGDIKVDISAVGPFMTKAAGEVADGVHVHPLHSVPYIETVLEPHLADGAARVGRDPNEIDLIIPVFTIVGDSEEEQEKSKQFAKQQIGFYGSTKNYSFQFDMLGFEGVSAKLNERLKAGDIAGMSDVITDDMLDHYAVRSSWDELGPRLLERYNGKASRVVVYQAESSIREDPANLAKWARVAEAVRNG